VTRRISGWAVLVAFLVALILVLPLLGYYLGRASVYEDQIRESCLAQGLEWRRDIGCYEVHP
jgi:hypothetical protein